MSAGMDFVADAQPHAPPATRKTSSTRVLIEVPATVIVLTCSRGATRYSLATFSLSAGFPVCSIGRSYRLISARSRVLSDGVCRGADVTATELDGVDDERR